MAGSAVRGRGCRIASNRHRSGSTVVHRCRRVGRCPDPAEGPRGSQRNRHADLRVVFQPCRGTTDGQDITSAGRRRRMQNQRASRVAGEVQVGRLGGEGKQAILSFGRCVSQRGVSRCLSQDVVRTKVVVVGADVLAISGPGAVVRTSYEVRLAELHCTASRRRTISVAGVGRRARFSVTSCADIDWLCPSDGRGKSRRCGHGARAAFAAFAA